MLTALGTLVLTTVQQAVASRGNLGVALFQAPLQEIIRPADLRDCGKRQIGEAIPRSTSRRR